MFHRFNFLILIVMVAGCGKASADKAAPTYKPPPVIHALAAPEQPTEARPENARELAAQYAKDLESDDPSIRMEASRHLRELGDIGYPHLLAAIKNPKLRLAGLLGLSPLMVQQQQKELVPLFLDLVIKDKDPAVRKQACICMTWVDRLLVGDEIQAGILVRERQAALRLVADRDESREVQDTARECLASVRDAAQGRLGAGIEPVKVEPVIGPDRPAPKRVLRP